MVIQLVTKYHFCHQVGSQIQVLVGIPEPKKYHVILVVKKLHPGGEPNSSPLFCFFFLRELTYTP